MKNVLLTCSLLVLSALSFAYKQQSIDITVNGQSRNMVVFTPTSLPDNSPLFIVTHGMNQNPEYQYDSDKMYELIDTAKFVVAYLRSNGNTWDIGGTGDQDFVVKTIDEMSNRFGIDKNRVYWSGFSMGSMLIHHCIANMQDKIAAFAPTSGIQFSEQPWNNCKKPVNLLEVIAYGDGVFGYEEYGIHSYIENYAKHDQHPNYKKTTGYKPIPSSWFDGDLEVWSGGPNGGEVWLYSYNNGGHWPNNLNPHLIWNFCKRFTLDPNVPRISILSPTIDKTYTSVDTIPVTFRVSDEDGTVKNAMLYIDGTARHSYKNLGVSDTLLTYSWLKPWAGDHTLRILVTDNDGKSRELQRTVTIVAPTPATITEAAFEDNSFDLPLSTREFGFVFDLKVRTDLIVAYLKNDDAKIDLSVAETGLSNAITLQRDEETALSEGTFTLFITKVRDERGVAADNFTYTYTFGTGDSPASRQYKTPFLEALRQAKLLYEETSDEKYATTKDLRKTLLAAIETYDNFSSTSPTAYTGATQALNDASAPLATRKQNLDSLYVLVVQADSLIALYADNDKVNTTTAYTNLVKAREYYTDEARIKNDTRILNSIKQLQAAIDALLTLTVGVAGVDNPDAVTITYYDTKGRLTEHPDGVVIRQTRLPNGQSLYRKIIVNK